MAGRFGMQVPIDAAGAELAAAVHEAGLKVLAAAAHFEGLRERSEWYDEYHSYYLAEVEKGRAVVDEGLARLRVLAFEIQGESANYK